MGPGLAKTGTGWQADGYRVQRRDVSVLDRHKRTDSLHSLADKDDFSTA